MNRAPGLMLSQALQAGDLAACLEAIETMRRLDYPAPLLAAILQRCHPGLDESFLDPALVPAPLLLVPALPEALAHSPLDPQRLAICHGDDLETFVRSGLNPVLRGERPLYSGLPPIPIAVYREQLRRTPKRRHWLQRLSALECLALEADPATLAVDSALAHWHPSTLDASLASAWVWLQIAADGEPTEEAEATAHLRALRLGFDAARVVSSLADCAALAEDASRLVLGRGGRYVLWNQSTEPPPQWGHWIRGLADMDPAPLIQLVGSGDGVISLKAVQSCSEPSLLAIDAAWLARRQPDRIDGLLRHWQKRPVRTRRRGGSGRQGTRWCGILLLTVTAHLAEQVGVAELERRARQRAVDGGFDRGELFWLDRPLAEQWLQWAAPGRSDTLVAFLGADDSTAPGAWPTLSRVISWQPVELICSDEELIWCREPRRVGLRQLEARPTAFRLLTRGVIPGLVGVPVSVLAGLDCAPTYRSLHALVRDLALQLMGRGARIHQLPEVLLLRDPLSNPAVLPISAPSHRQGLSHSQLQELTALVQRQARSRLLPEGVIATGPRQGTFMVRRLPQPKDRVSVLIPFRDQAALTRSCVASLLSNAGGMALELVLIDNGSTEEDAIGLAAELQQHSPVPVIGLRDERPFNFAALNNRARQSCTGNFLLFLNNDIVFQSPRVIEQVLDPFGCRDVGAVGARMVYADGRIQHHGLMAVAGQFHDIQSPGKGMEPGAATAMVAALEVQEQWSAATAACLMVRAEAFDQIGGFEESFAVAYNDVDLCWRLGQQGFAVVVTPEPRILHLESHSRGRDRKGEKRKRLYQESARLRERYPRRFVQGDPLHHPKLNPDSRLFEPVGLEDGGGKLSQNHLIWAWRRPEFRAGRERSLMIYVHWDGNGEVREDVLEQLREYRRHVDLAFVSACPDLVHDQHRLQQLRDLCDVVLIRENEGHDFGSWKAGISYCWPDVMQTPELILANDSCYGPIFSLEGLFRRLKQSSADVVGLTEVTTVRPHLQSYFIAYRSRVVRAPVFREFWERVSTWNSKIELVKHNEVGWSATLEKAGYTREALYMQGHGNITHTHWKELIEEKRFPFIKKELLERNPRRMDIHNWREILNKERPGLTEVIDGHLSGPWRSC
ncbi:glycosyltransferase [Cyanobium sp. ATX 6A2]|uniref:rhamnan synthesis F family protein n=1 Tax=Cyanobium sp. ATX 6A2 TaxID=2823700 RepID=UPI0020CE3D1B|nr:rhamnan synthesis F family protein [Cyanobium sp. ATX 6A2]MCP9889261.1 glycosyltransferase [Cyanobium sp. ATX 6A2]